MVEVFSSFYCHGNCHSNVLKVNGCQFFENALVTTNPFGGAGAAIGITPRNNGVSTNNTLTFVSSMFTNNSRGPFCSRLTYLCRSKGSQWRHKFSKLS